MTLDIRVRSPPSTSSPPKRGGSGQCLSASAARSVWPVCEERSPRYISSLTEVPVTNHSASDLVESSVWSWEPISIASQDALKMHHNFSFEDLYDQWEEPLSSLHMSFQQYPTPYISNRERVRFLASLIVKLDYSEKVQRRTLGATKKTVMMMRLVHLLLWTQRLDLAEQPFSLTLHTPLTDWLYCRVFLWHRSHLFFWGRWT